jgi:hypothetical protein
MTWLFAADGPAMLHIEQDPGLVSPGPSAEVRATLPLCCG